MGEVSKRCKNQWMRWTAEGLEAILQLRLVKYADPESTTKRSSTNCSNVRPKQQSTVTSQLRVPAAKSRPLCNTTNLLKKHEHITSQIIIAGLLGSFRGVD